MSVTATPEQIVSRLTELLESATHGRVATELGLGGSTPLRSLDLDSATLLSFLVAVEETFVNRNAASTLRLGSSTSSSKRSNPRPPMPSRFGPTFAPLPPT